MLNILTWAFWMKINKFTEWKIDLFIWNKQKKNLFWKLLLCTKKITKQQEEAFATDKLYMFSIIYWYLTTAVNYIAVVNVY